MTAASLMFSCSAPVGVSHPKMAAKSLAWSPLKSISCGVFERSKVLHKGDDGIMCKAQAIHVESAPLSFSSGQKFQLDDVIEAQQFDRDTLSAIFEVAKSMESIKHNSSGSQMLKGYLMATLFYEPSTRTRLSFESAMKRLGGDVLTTENAREFSSAAKGETLEGGAFKLTIHSYFVGLFHCPV